MRVIPLFWLLFPLGLPAKELVICGTMEPPLKYLDADQKPHGLDIDIVTAIFDKLETPFRVELADSGARLTRNAETGACDLVMTHSYKAERVISSIPNRPIYATAGTSSCARRTC